MHCRFSWPFWIPTLFWKTLGERLLAAVSYIAFTAACHRGNKLRLWNSLPRSQPSGRDWPEGCPLGWLADQEIPHTGQMPINSSSSTHMELSSNMANHVLSRIGLAAQVLYQIPVVWSTVETLYNTVNFCWNTHKRHSIARPKGRGMGCLLCVQRATYCVDLSKLSSIKYLL